MYKIHPALFGQYILSQIFPFVEKIGEDTQALFQSQIVGNYLKTIHKIKETEHRELLEDALSCASSDDDQEEEFISRTQSQNTGIENFF